MDTGGGELYEVAVPAGGEFGKIRETLDSQGNCYLLTHRPQDVTIDGEYLESNSNERIGESLLVRISSDSELDWIREVKGESHVYQQQLTLVDGNPVAAFDLSGSNYNERL